jgi:hypothetical protein
MTNTQAIQEYLETIAVTGVKQPESNQKHFLTEIPNYSPTILAGINNADVDKGTARKFDGDKLPLNLLSTEAMNQTAAVLKFGAQKYAEHNWRKGFAWSRPLAAAMRHITAFNDGEDKDPESGLSHISHAMCCLMFISEFEKTRPDLDDRYKPDTQN